MNEEIKIPLKKSKLLFGICATILFTFLNIIIVFVLLFGRKNLNQPLVFLMIISLIGIIIFGTLSFFGLKRVLNKKYNLVIDKFGITDNFSEYNFGLIKWNQIVEIKTKEIVAPNMKTATLLLIIPKNPEIYFGNANKIKQFFMKINNRKYGTPITINVGNLEYDLNTIELILKSKFEKYNT